jgi:hypothetical protein
MSFSGALRHTKTLADLIHLLRNRQWGPGFSDLDGVSVVGALVWLVKSDEWQQLQQEGSVGQEQWQAQQTVLKCLEVSYPLDPYRGLQLYSYHNSLSVPGLYAQLHWYCHPQVPSACRVLSRCLKALTLI